MPDPSTTAAVRHVATRHGRRLGSSVDLTVVGAPAVAERAMDAAWEQLVDLDARWSRFRPSSEVSALNAAAGQPVPVSAATRDLLRRAVDAWHLTGGRVDALVLDDLLALGYDRSHELLAPPRGEGRPRPAPPTSTAARAGRPTAAAIAVDDAAGTATLPAGAGFDPGGVGKGRIADLVVAVALEAGADGACADLGGDVAVAGTPPDGDAWHVGIAHPSAAGRLATVALADGAVATSATTRRRWRHGQEVVHHLVDPATGRPAATDVVAATVLAAEAQVAEVLAKAAVLAGLAEGVALLGEAGATGLLVTTEGLPVPVAGFAAFEVHDDPAGEGPARVAIDRAAPTAPWTGDA